MIGLTRVKQSLQDETLTNLNSALSELQGDVEGYLSKEQASSLEQAISLVRPEVSAAVERVSSWFVLSKSHEYQDYPLRIAFDVGLATVTSYFSNLNISASIEGADLITMAGWTLPSFARLFLLLMENAALHSGITEGQLIISATASLREGLLELSIVNQLAEATDLPLLDSVVSKLNADFGSEASQDFVGTEHGSGYPKLWKILRHDLRRDHAIEVRITKDIKYCVDIVMNRESVAL